MSTLERAIAVAARAHEGQQDKGGTAYILHPLRVMLRVQTTEQRIVGVVGIIGPTRLNYARIVPMVDYTAKVVGRLLDGAR